MSVASALTAIGDRLRALLGVTDKYPLGQMPQAISDVWAKGKQQVLDDSDLEAVTVVGNPVCVDDVSELAHDVTVQLSSDTMTDFSGVEILSEGANLLDVTVFNTTRGGVLFITNNDGTVTAKEGTATFAIWYAVGTINVTTGETYFCSGAPAGSATGTSRMQFQAKLNGTTVKSYNDTGKGVSIVADGSFNQIVANIIVANGYTINNVVFRPRIQLATDKDTTHTPSASGLLTLPRKFPQMVLTCDSPDVTVSLTYYKSKGIQTEHDRFWDRYQQYGALIDYMYAFYGKSWTHENFKPKYDIRPEGNCNGLFSWSGIAGDLVELLEKQGVVLDLSKVTILAYIFSNSQLTRVGIVDASGVATASNASYVFYNALHLQQIDLIIVAERHTYTNWFNNDKDLREVRFQGVIGNDLDIHWSTQLSALSFVSTVEHLTSTATGKTLTVSDTAVANADWSTTNYASWDELVATRTNWTFSRV